MSDIHFQGIWRMDWGLGNPNKTAALIAILMIAVWGLAFIRNGKNHWGFWAALLPFTGLGVCLIHTMSRGGLIALFAGLLPLIITAPRPWLRSKMIALGVVAWIIIGASIFLNAHHRFEQGIIHEDRSITNRFLIWKDAPRMMVDAPGGWGFGNAAPAYEEWYQPLTRHEFYGSLINSHLTWLVEMGWPLRLAYLFGWGGVFLLCWPGRTTRWFAIPLGIWIAFAVAATFSSVADTLWLWLIPIASLLAVIGYRLSHADWPTARFWLIPSGAAVALCGVFYSIGASHPSLIHRSGDALLIGGTSPQTWILADPMILGKTPGRTIRGAAEKQSLPVSFAMCLNPDRLPSMQGKQVILSGNPASHEQLEKILREATSVELVNPEFFPQEVGVAKDEAHHAFNKLLIGEFFQSPASVAWNEILPAHILSGTGAYIPNWIITLFDASRRDVQ